MKKKTVEELLAACGQLRTLAQFVQPIAARLDIGLTPENIAPTLKLADKAIREIKQQLYENDGFLD